MANRYQDMILAEQRERIAGVVVGALDDLPKDIYQKFRGVMQKGRPIPGFNKDPFRAPAGMLIRHMAERMERIPEFAIIVADTWTYSQHKLRDDVHAHLDKLGQRAVEMNDDNREFWDEQLAALAAKHGDYEENDVLLMMKICHAAGGPPATDGAAPDASDPAARTTGALTVIFDHLNNLPAEAPHWDGEIPRFAQRLTALMGKKDVERKYAASINNDMKEAIAAYADELAFLGANTAGWDAAKLSNSDAIRDTAAALSDLTPLLEKYQPIRAPADNIADERARRQAREELEDAITPLTTRIDELMRAAESPPQDDAPDDADAAQPSAESLMDAAGRVSALQAQVMELTESKDALQAELRELVKSDAQRQAQTAELAQSNESLQAQVAELTQSNETLQGANDGLRSDAQTLKDEMSDLQGQLHISKQQEIAWRNQYEELAAERAHEDAPEPVPQEFESIEQALELAKKRYPNRLVIRPNKKSEVSNFYRNPGEVWRALEWLATTYYDTQMGKERIPDLNESLRQVCSGWSYAGDQTDITVNTYLEWYTTMVDGVRYEVRKHIGKGRTRSANNIIRIGFDWDADSERIIVGYIGPHQRNRKS